MERRVRNGITRDVRVFRVVGDKGEVMLASERKDESFFERAARGGTEG